MRTAFLLFAFGAVLGLGFLPAASRAQFSDLPFDAAKLLGLITACDVGKLLSISGELGDLGKLNVSGALAIIVEKPQIFDAVCSKETCAPAIVDALDWSKLPPELSTPEIQLATKVVAPKLCVKSHTSGKFCTLELATAMHKGKADPKICSDGCYDLIGDDTIEVAKPVLETLDLANGDKVMRDQQAACKGSSSPPISSHPSAEATFAPTASPTQTRTASPTKEIGPGHRPPPDKDSQEADGKGGTGNDSNKTAVFPKDGYPTIKAACMGRGRGGDSSSAEALIGALVFSDATDDAVTSLFTNQYAVKAICGAPEPEGCAAAVGAAINYDALPSAYQGGDVAANMKALEPKFCMTRKSSDVKLAAGASSFAKHAAISMSTNFFCASEMVRFASTLHLYRKGASPTLCSTGCFDAMGGREFASRDLNELLGAVYASNFPSSYVKLRNVPEEMTRVCAKPARVYNLEISGATVDEIMGDSSILMQLRMLLRPGLSYESATGEQVHIDSVKSQDGTTVVSLTFEHGMDGEGAKAMDAYLNNNGYSQMVMFIKYKLSGHHDISIRFKESNGTDDAKADGVNEKSNADPGVDIKDDGGANQEESQGGGPSPASDHGSGEREKEEEEDTEKTKSGDFSDSLSIAFIALGGIILLAVAIAKLRYRSTQGYARFGGPRQSSDGLVQMTIV